MARIETRGCGSCGRRYEILHHRDGPGALDQPVGKEDDLSCPGCGGNSYRELIGGGQGIQLGGSAGQGRIYPYYDRGLGHGGDGRGVYVESAAHRQRLMKERGLIEASGDGWDEVWKKELAEERRCNEARDRMHANERQYEDDSAFADYRTLRDKGAYSDPAIVGDR